MKTLPLKTKLFVVTLATVLLLALAMTWRSYSGISGLSQDLSDLTQKNLREEVVARLQTEAMSYGEQVGGYINSAFRLPLTFKYVLENSISSEQRLSREQVNEMFQQILLANKDISSAYVQFESNAYDNEDDQHTDGSNLHSIENVGSFELYWFRDESGQITQTAVLDPEEKHLATTNEYGVRTAEWYLCPRDTKAPCLVEPYMEEVSEGYEELMSTLSAPVIVNNRFRGTIGVDINLPLFQKLTEKLSQSLYNGQARVTLVSQLGQIVASSHYKNKVTHPLIEALPRYGQQLKDLHKNQGVLFSDEDIYVAHAVNIPAAQGQWSLLIALPTEVAMAQLNTMENLASSKTTSVISSLVIISLILAVLSLAVIVLLIRSITQPINKLNHQVEQLASAEGDLSQRLTLDAHAELIILGSNFNRFMHKLRDLVLSLKDIGQQVRSEALENLSVSERTRASTDQQQSEIDNVVTATQEMSATAQEVARIASDVATRSNEIHSTVVDSQQNLAKAVDTVLELSTNMRQASSSITKVSERSDDINRILVVIGSIAEQTNLLALNAAIEAARAGEQGRGFAVVADEVRTLASRTQSSTTEINTMIGDLQSEVKQAVGIIEQGAEQASSAMDSTRQAHEFLHRVVEAIGEIADNIRQVATAAEEQSSVSEEITRNLTVIGDAAQTLANLAQQANQSSHNVTNQLDELDRQLNALRT